MIKDRIDEAFNNLERIRILSKADPLRHKENLKKAKREQRILPRSLRRAYQSKDKQHIEKEITKAISGGFTKQEIHADFQKWKDQRD